MRLSTVSKAIAVSSIGLIFRRSLTASMVLTLLLSAFSMFAQTPQPGTSEYDNAKTTGTLVQPSLSMEYYGEMPDVSHYIADAENRDGDCYIPHDPATWTEFPGNDDGYLGSIALPFSFDLYGDTYNSFYLNNNGNVTFNNGVSAYTPDGFPISTPMVAPFWGDVDTRNDLGEVWYFVDDHAMYVNWVEVGVFYAFDNTDPALRNTFQLIITDGSDPVLDAGNNIAFNYLDMGWTTGDASDGVNGFGGSPATVGVNSGNGIDFIQIGRFGTNTDDYDGPNGETDGVNWLDDQCFQFNVSSAENFPPVAQGFPNGNSLTVCQGDVVDLSVGFIGPEGNEEVTVVVSGDSNINVDVNTPGNPSVTSFTVETSTVGEYEFIFTATDNGQPAESTVRTLTVNVEQCVFCVPNVSIVCPADATVECGESIAPEALGLPVVNYDPCYTDGVDVSFNDEIISSNNCSTVYARTWMVTAGDEVDMCTQTIEVVDTQAPELDLPPLYYSLEWSVFNGNFLEDFANGELNIFDLVELYPLFNEQLEAQGYFFPTATDACDQEVFPIYSQTVEGPEDLDCPMVARVVWTFSAQDNCGNTTDSFDVVCEFFDTTAPEFTNLPESFTVQCIEDVPEPVEPEAEDACADVVSTDVFTSETGFPINECVASTAFGLGDDWAIWLPVLETSGVSLTDDFVPVGDLSFVQFNDGTAHASGTVVNNMNPNQGFIIDFWFENTVDWATWSAMGRSYKDDAGFAAAGGDLWTTWSYMEMVNGFSTLTGTGDFAGSVLYMNHMPSNYYFGFQCGEAANNKNANFGMSGWFTYTGILNGEAVTGHGDMNVDKECEPNNEIPCVNFDEFTYFFRAEDTCGNVNIDSYTVTVDDTTAPEFTVVPEDLVVECDMVPVPVFEGIEAIDNCDCGVTILPMVESEIEGDACNYSFTRTWGAIDCCGNRTDHVQTITVIDTVAPVFTFVPADATYECSDEIILEDAIGEDNCQEVQYSVSTETIEGDCPQEFTLVRTFTISDECNEPVTATQTITVVDTTAPSVNDYDVQTSASCEDVESVPGPIFEDNCGEVTVTVETQNQSGGCMGVLVRWYTAVDECGNTTTAEQYITILDNTPPVIVTPADMTVECDDIPAAPGVEGADVSDNCALEVDVTFNEEIIPGECDNAYSIVWTWTATDYCENVSEASTTITVVDTTSPVFVEFPANVTVECSDELPAVVYPLAEDNCDENVEVELTVEEVPGSCEGEYTINRIFRGFDNCGNEVIGVQVISVVDTTAPVFTSVPGELTVECNTDIPASEATAEDACSTATVTYTDGPAEEGQCPQEQFIVRTFTAVDACGNASTATQLIHIVDTTAPVFDAYEVETEAPCDNIVFAALTATDNCGMVTIDYTDTPVSGGCAGRIIRDYVATDECGNSSTAQQIITLIDEVAPVFVEFPGDMDVECDDIPAVAEGLFAEDNCDDEVEISFEGIEIIPGDCPYNYTILRTWIAVDHCDNEATYVQTINVSDNTAPEFEFVAESVTIECDETIPAADALAFDNCGEVSIEVTEEEVAGDCPQNYAIVRTYTATDECGNMNTASQTITIVDTTAPEFTFVPENLELECDEEVPAVNAEAADNCGETSVTWVDYYDYTPWVAGSNGGNGIVDLSNLPNGFAINGSDAGEDEENDEADVYTFAMTAVKNVTLSFDWEFNSFDEDGASFDPFVYVINDGEPVNISDDFGSENQSGSFSVALEAGSSFSMGIWSTDNALGLADVTVSNINFEINEFECPVTDCFIRQFTAVDECGNSATADQTIVKVDTTAPIFDAYEVEVEAPCDNVSVIELMATDNCSEVEVSYTDTPVSGGCAGRIIRDYVATDACGNTATAQQIITLIDEVAPVFVEFPGDMDVECDDVPAVAEGLFADDNCDEQVDVDYVGEEIIAGDCPYNYTILRTWIAIDHCDNEATYTQTINVTDTTAPEFEFVAESVTIECDETIPAADALAFDNCGEVTIEVTEEEVAGDCPQNYSIVRTYTAMDECGNMNTASQTITIVDTTAPIFTDVAENITIECDQVAGDPFAVAEDNCGEVTITSVDVESELPNGDDCGQYRTQTPGGWGSPANGNNPGVYRDANFDAAFPDGLTIGCNNTLTLTSASAVEDFLPSGGQASVLPGDLVDPDYNNTFAGHLVATTLSLGFDAFDSNFGEATGSLGDLILNNGDLEGYSVAEVVAIANSVIGGCTNEFTPSELTGALTLINENYIDGNQDNGNLDCEPTGDCGYIITRTYTATDECGNSANATQVITVVDTTAPVFDTYEVEVEAPCDNVEVVELTATDNCSEVVITYTDTPVSGGCAGRIIRDYVATDECGNEATAQQIITLTDNVAPVLFGVPADVTVECGLEEIPEAAQVGVEDNCDNEVEVMFSETENMLDCGYEIVRTWSAVDHCDNEVSATQTITITDTTAPEFEFESSEEDVDCNAQILLVTPEAFDACDEEVEVTSDFESIPGDCPNEWTEIYTYTATDDCGNASSISITLNYIDDSAPEFTFVPFSNEVSCDQPLPTDVATATDNCGDVTITSSDEIIPGDCENNYEVIRTWTATDECGNSASAETSYYVYDFTAPVFDGQPADISVECAEDVPALTTPTATDNCSDVTVDCVEEIIEEDNCGNYIKVVTCTATDACGNSSSVNYTITVNDVTAPVLSGLPDASLVLDCQDEIPAADEVTALDNCEGVVDVDFNEVLVGELPAEGSTADCLAVTPEAFENGEVCTGEDPWSLKLFNFNGLASALYSTIEANWVEYPDGTATLTGSVVSNIDPNRGWNIAVEFENGMDWADWSTQGFPTNYKDDCNESGDNHFDWTYYIMSAGATLTGWGSFDGATLNLAHAPANYYYGYQVGVAANNVNVNYGSGGWFTYSGVFNQQEVMGSGDFAFDHDCCPRYSIERTWCATDCSGNETCFTQLISFEDLDGINPIAGDGMEAVVFEPKGDFQITRIAPNPSSVRTMVEYYSSTFNTVELAVYDMSGRKIEVLFQGNVSKGETYRVDFATAGLESGMYTVRLSSENHADYQKLVVTK